MSTAPVDAREREALCDLLISEGPDAPTLCAGWTTLDLAAHLVVREHDLRAPLAILGGSRFAGLEQRLRRGAADRGLAPLVERLRSGPPPVPWRLPGLRTPLNLAEWFVHHEDVRRARPTGSAGAEPRTDVPDLDDALWGLLRTMGRFLVARVRGVGVRIVAPGHGTLTLKGGEPAVTLTGSPQELILYLHGRRSAARVERDGSPEALATLDAAPLGV